MEQRKAGGHGDRPESGQGRRDQEARKVRFINYKGNAMAERFVKAILAAALVCAMAGNALGWALPKDPPLGAGFTKDFSARMEDVLQAVQEVLADETIHGTLIFDRQPVLNGAKIVDSTPLFETWNGPGKVFYKIRPDAIAPRHFLGSADQGTIAVRYIVSALGPERVRVHIDAVYVETTHRIVHISDGSVETSECKEIENRLNTIQVTEQETLEANRRRESAELVKETRLRERAEEAKLLSQTLNSTQEIEQQIDSLRHELERRVKAPGADLKAAPFLSSASVATLPAYTELMVVIVTPHWLGVETPDGHRGWLRMDRLEPLP
jgi:hypothetical protein